ncbi:hypothetical protein DKP76_07110 [Falsochrobactrum shanghaiense]|uniref:DUF3168 domain-containing protein n=1 Tax=Falsochrobactrum shanghaiense TaxID=2201899 RepID=A0A316JBU0_9HYPH|nr:DUF3168 domain-containing protein [Falsochrobactrum shanghaiense]PWL18826.1 hypothetical protein DKP76_07110 [Falsochrobactrum shanghaiense]
MGSPNLALQAALISTIRGINTAAGTRVYSYIPDNAAYPYVQVWPGFETPIDEECWDRTESTMQIDVWADQLNYIKTKDVAAAIRNALHEQNLTIAGHTVDRIRVESIVYTDDPPLYRARMSISIETQPS